MPTRRDDHTPPPENGAWLGVAAILMLVMMIFVAGVATGMNQ